MSSSSEEKTLKRRREAEEDLARLFSVTLPTSSSFKNAIDIISNVIQIATFSIDSDSVDDDCVVIKLDSLDSAHVAAIKMRLVMIGSVHSDAGVQFACKIKTLLAMLKTLPSNETIEMFQISSDSLQLESKGMESHKYSVKALDYEFEEIPMRDMNADYSIEFEVERLKKFINCALRIKANNLKIEIMETSTAEISIKFSCEGDEASAAWWFDGNTKFSSSQKMFTLCSSDGERDADNVTFTAMYDVNRIQSFIKSMERNSVILAFIKESGSENSKPLIMEYSLGQENSSVRFILAEQVNTD